MANKFITYSPNAFGEPTQAVREGFEYATNATYYANGMLNGFTYGNGLAHKTLLNTRQLPESIVDKLGDTIAIDQSYTYDAENNLKSLTDGIDDLYSITNITYDGLERVTDVFANSEMGNSSISYDGLGNIKTYSSLNANLKYEYEHAKNRLTKVNQMSGSTITSTVRDFTNGYDAKGNVTNNGERNFTYNAAYQTSTNLSGRRQLTWPVFEFSFIACFLR